MSFIINHDISVFFPNGVNLSGLHKSIANSSLNDIFEHINVDGNNSVSNIDGVFFDGVVLIFFSTSLNDNQQAELDDIISTHKPRIPIELEDEFKIAAMKNFKSFSYNNNLLSSIEIYEDNTQTNLLFQKDFSYSNDRLDQSIITKIVNGTTLTKTLIYSGDQLISIEMS